MSGFVFHPGALADLTEIWEYIAADSLAAADRVVEEIREAVRSVCLPVRPRFLGQPKCSVTDSSSALSPFQAICTPMQTRKNDDNCVITVIPVAPRIRASRSANP